MKAGTDIPALTGLRGIAAIYVVLYHYFIPIGTWKNAPTTLIGHGYLAVDVFFVLSGFVMALNYSHMFETGWTRAHYFKFLGRRIARIYPVYLVTTLTAFALLAIGFMAREPGSSSAATLIKNLLMVQCWWGRVPSLNAPAWSLSTEWFAYLIFPLLLIPTLSRGFAAAVLTGAVAVAALAVLCTLPPHIRGLPNPQAVLDFIGAKYCLPIVRCVAEFTLGLLTYRIATSPFGPKLGESRWLPAAVCVFIFVMLLIPKTDLLVVMALPPLLLAIAFGRNLPLRLLSTRAAQYAGRLSYSLYLTHELAGATMGWSHRAAQAAGIRHAQTVAAAGAIVLAVPAAVLLYYLVEIPGRNYLRALFEGAAGKRTTPTRLPTGPELGA